MNMKTSFFALSLGFAGAVWAVFQADAAPANCAARGVVVERLHEKFGETRRAVGLARNKALVEVFASAETGSWTIVVSLPNGLSCLVASGKSWEQLHEARAVPGSGA